MLIACRVLQVGSACCISCAMVVLRAVAYNPMSANWTRLQSISDELGSAAIIGLPGTARKHQTEFGPCRVSRLHCYTVRLGLGEQDGGYQQKRVELPCSSGVMSCPQVVPIVSHTEVCTMAPNTAPSYDRVNRKLLEWANKIRGMLPTRCNFILLFDANAHIGLPPWRWHHAIYLQYGTTKRERQW